MYKKTDILNKKVHLENWQNVIFMEFNAAMNNKERPFPCLFGVTGYKSDMLRFSFFEKIDAKNIKDELVLFCENYKQYGKQTSLVMFERPSKVESIEDYYKRFWQLLKDLANLDDEPLIDTLPKELDHPAWEFCFHGVPLFVVCNTPAHINRLSRRSPTFSLTIQPRWVFEGLLDTKEKADVAFETVSKRLEPFDVISKSKVLGRYGNPENREWKQYFLDDDNTNSFSCPYTSLKE